VHLWWKFDGQLLLLFGLVAEGLLLGHDRLGEFEGEREEEMIVCFFVHDGLSD
jgi:hypothetical protein